ncbi:MAG: MotA/TolQ/ExbB proton channel family protein, partial [Victivallales bacterium]|nr:MotA/TolQ/ExbB proton channel family protein [Victivallales bacterium]
MFLVDAFNNSDIVGQGIVVLLLVANCWCWSQVANKRLDTAGIRTRCRRFLECFKKHKFEVPLRIFAELGNKKFASPLAELTKAVRDTLLATLKVDSAQKARLVEDGVLPRPLKQSELDGLRVSLNRALTQQVINLESGMTGMSTIISLSPMLGLFGTVWGVLKTFVGINNAGGRP